MMNCENPKIILKGKWRLVRIMGKDNTIIKSRSLHMDMNTQKYEQVIKYYDDLLSLNNNKTLSLLSSIFCSKNITGIGYKGEILTIQLEKEPIFLGKNSEVKVFLDTPDIKDNKNEVLNAAYKNYDDSRRQFLDKNNCIKEQRYLINTKSKNTTYDSKNNVCIFNLMDYDKSLFCDEERKFLADALNVILSECNDIAYINYNVTTVNNDTATYYVNDLFIEVDDKQIFINIVSPEEYEHIIDIINNHNKKIEHAYVKKQKKEGDGCNE